MGLLDLAVPVVTLCRMLTVEDSEVGAADDESP